MFFLKKRILTGSYRKSQIYPHVCAVELFGAVFMIGLPRCYSGKELPSSTIGTTQSVIIGRFKYLWPCNSLPAGRASWASAWFWSPAHTTWLWFDCIGFQKIIESCVFLSEIMLLLDFISLTYHCWRLNRVVSLVTVFHELSHSTSPLWSCDKVNQGIPFFHKMDLRRADVVVCPSTVG